MVALALVCLVTPSLTAQQHTLEDTLDWITATANSHQSVRFVVAAATQLRGQVNVTLRGSNWKNVEVTSHHACILEVADYAEQKMVLSSDATGTSAPLGTPTETWHENRWKVDLGKLSPSLTLVKAVTVGTSKAPCIEGRCTFQEVILRGADSQFLPTGCTDKQPSADPANCIAELTPVRSYFFRFVDLDLASRFVTALKAAIVMCGGKDVDPRLY